MGAVRLGWWWVPLLVAAALTTGHAHAQQQPARPAGAAGAGSSTPRIAQTTQPPGQPPSSFVPADPDEVPAQGEPVAPAESGATPVQPAAGAPSTPGQPAMAPATAPAQPGAMPPTQPGAMMRPEPPATPPRSPERDWERGALEHLYAPEPGVVRIAILNGSGKPQRAGMVAFYLEQYRREELERKVGKRLTVVNLSNLNRRRRENSVIYYRPDHLRAALLIAEVMPGKQLVTPISQESSGKIGIDVEIRIGAEMP